MTGDGIAQTRGRRRRRPIMFTMILLMAAGSAAADISMPAASLLPADSQAVIWSRPAKGERSSGMAMGLLVGLLNSAEQMGIVQDVGGSTRILLDVAEALPLISVAPATLALLDVSARKRDADSFQLDRMQAALILETNGQNEAVEGHIQKLLSRHTDNQKAKLSKATAKGKEYFRLVDSRLPAWAVFEWGPIGDCYVLSLGQGAFERLLETHERGDASLAHDGWLRAARSQCRPEIMRMAWYIDLRGVQQKLGEVMAGRPKQVLEKLGLGEMDKGFWSFGNEGRATVCLAYLREKGGDRLIRISDPQTQPPAILACIPDQAKSYAVVECDVAQWIRRARDAYWASQSEGTRRALERSWRRVEAENGLFFEQQFLNQLGHHIVFHTYPIHPLDLPILCTVLIEIDGDTQAVRAACDGLLLALRRYFDEFRDIGALTAFVPQIIRDEDAVWYVQLGIYGPALTIVDGWIIISFSPRAVRANRDYLVRQRASR